MYPEKAVAQGAPETFNVTDGTFATLQAAIQSANDAPGSTVYITEPVTLDDELTITSSMTIKGSDRATVLKSGDTSKRLFSIEVDGETETIDVKFENITLEGGDISPDDDYDDEKSGGIILLNNTAAEMVEWSDLFESTFKLENVLLKNSKAYNGGAIYSKGGWNLTINNSDFQKNKARYFGGAISLKNSLLSIEQSSFTENECGYIDDDLPYGDGGGAIYLSMEKDNYIESDICNLYKVTFQSNKAIQGKGGAFYANGIALKITDCKFLNNTLGYEEDIEEDEYIGERSGGAVFASSGSYDKEYIKYEFNSSHFTSNNSIAGDGGAIGVYGGILSVVNGCTFTGNIAGFAGHYEGKGGAISFDAEYSYDIEIEGKEGMPTIQILNAEFIDNQLLSHSSGLGGGAIFCHGYSGNMNLVINNTHFINNVSGGKGGAISFYSGYDFSANNCNFLNNQAGYSLDDTIDDYCDCMQGGAISIQESYNANIKDCNFTENKAVAQGGAVYIALEGGEANIEGGEFQRNYLISKDYDENNDYPHEYKGGALFMLMHDGCCEYGVSNVATIKDVLFKDNYIESSRILSNAQGGAAYLAGGVSGIYQLKNTNFDNNYIHLKGQKGTAGGGAIAIESTEVSIEGGGQLSKYLVFSNNYILIEDYEEGCCSNGGGGAIQVGSCTPSLSVMYALFEGNYVKVLNADNARNIGGGAVAASCSENPLYFLKTTFDNNYVDINSSSVRRSGGGAIFLGGASLSLLESTLFNNKVNLTATDIDKSGGGAIYSQDCCTGMDIVNTTITRNSIIFSDEPTLSGGAGVFGGDARILNSVLVGNFLNSSENVEDIYIYQERLPERRNPEEFSQTYLKMANSIYEKINGSIYDEPFNATHWLDIKNQISNVSNVFGGEPLLTNNVIRISETGKAAFYGTLTGMVKVEDECCSHYEFYFLKDNIWNRFICCELIEEVPFDKGNSSNFGLTVDRSVYNYETEEEETKTFNGDIFIIAQNEVNRLAFGHDDGIYNAGAYALEPTTPQPNPDVSLQWSVSTTDGGTFADVADGTQTKVTEPTPVYLQIRPVVEESLKYDSWTIDYSVVPTDCYYPISGSISSTQRYDFKNGEAHTEVGTYVYTVTSVTLYQAGNNVGTFSFRSSPYTHTIVIDKPDKPTPPDPDPDPWPPVLPEDPDDPDPNPNALILIHPLAPYCYTEEYLVVTYDILNTNKSIEYAVAFTDAAKAAGFKDIPEYKALPKNGVITIPVNTFIPKGVYHGYLVLREKGTKDVEFYPFKIEVVEYVKIVKDPVSVSHLCVGDEFTLSVEATGDVLSYQWYFKKEKIVGATQSTYSNIISETTIGDYYAKVIGYCNVDSSKVANVGLNEFRTLLKWDDVLYMTNLDNRFIKFQWYKNGQAITTHGNGIYYTDPDGLLGSYYLRAYTSETNYIESCPIDFPIHTRGTSLSVYPSPVNQGEYVTVESNEVGESYIGAQIDLYDMNGRKVYTTRATAPKVQIPMSVATGVYMVQILHQSGKVTTHKIVVK